MMEMHNNTTAQKLIQSNLNALKNEIAKICKDRKPPQLIAVSKTQPFDMITAAYQCGLRAFAENYAKELETKTLALDLDDIEWHFIGKIQSNKTKIIAKYASWVHSLTNISHAKLLDQHRRNFSSPLQVLIEVNISNEVGKGGLTTFAQILDLANSLQELPNLKLVGLMGMASHTKDSGLINSQFQTLNNYLQSLNALGFNLDQLSMGMSEDYLLAVANGATHLRIGTKIFGKRN